MKLKIHTHVVHPVPSHGRVVHKAHRYFFVSPGVDEFHRQVEVVEMNTVWLNLILSLQYHSVVFRRCSDIKVGFSTPIDLIQFHKIFIWTIGLDLIQGEWPLKWDLC